MTSKKIAVIGSRSRMGTRLMEKAKQNGYQPIGFARVKDANADYAVDITQKTQIDEALRKTRPDVVILVAAMTDVDGCEKDQKLAWSINVDGSENVAAACEALKLKLINISTDYVFDGKNGPYSEDAAPNPINVYGLTKLEGEKKIHSICKNALTLRTAVPYDWNPSAKPNFLMWLIEKLEQKSKVKIVTDQWNTPTFYPHLAEIILKFVERGPEGIFHVAGREFLSRYDFAVKTCGIFGYDEKLIESATSNEFKQIARRPLKNGLKVQKAEQFLGSQFMSVDEGLQATKQLRGENRK